MTGTAPAGDMRFDGRTALVTGAGRGLGRSYALLLAARGANLVVNDPGVGLDGSGGDHQAAQSVVDEIVAAGGKAVANFDSVGSEAASAAMVRQAMDKFGGIDILVNNAGNFRPGVALLDTTAEDMEAVMRVHLMGSFNTIRAAWPHMVARRYGRIVNTSSHIGYVGQRGLLPYSAAKAAIHGLTRSLSFEGAEHGITVNGISPGALTRPVRQAKDVEERFPPGSFDPDLVAPTVAWLAHESCTVNGESFGVMAGTTLRFAIAETPGHSCRAPTPEILRDNADEMMGQDLLDASGLTFAVDGVSRGRELAERFPDLA